MVAQTYLDNHWDGNVPVNVIAICKGAGVDVLIMDRQGKSSIDVKPSESSITVMEPREIPRRYKVAYFLGLYDQYKDDHPRTIPETADCFSSSHHDLVVMRANLFARALLMPERVLNYAIVTDNVTTIAGLSKVFNVSEVAVRERLRDLRIL